MPFECANVHLCRGAFRLLIAIVVASSWKHDGQFRRIGMSSKVRVIECMCRMVMPSGVKSVLFCRNPPCLLLGT